MKLHLPNRHSFHYVALIFLTLFFFESKSQTHTQRRVSMIANSWGYWEYLPQNYSAETGTYPLLVFVHGIGELGDGGPDQLPKVLANGTPKTISNGTFPVSFTVNGETFKFIVISPQFLNWPSTNDIQGVIDYAVKTYRVNTSRIYLTGLSMGGGAVWDYAGANIDNANRLAALVPVCGVSGPVDERISVLTRTALPIWATHNQNDPDVSSANTIGYIDKIAALNLILNPLSILISNPVAKKTIFAVTGHDAWSTTYNPNYKENNKNVYEWMLQYTRGGAAPAPTPPAPAPAPPAQNQAPTSNAGADQWITLPTSSVTLSGSGKDADGTIANYSWTKIAGPAQYNISFGNIANPILTNLVEGTYLFRLTVTDNSGATAADDVTIIVSPAPVVAPPVTTPVAIPGKIETENYTSMFGVINEKTIDDGGGQAVGWIEYGDWMDYSVNVATAGSYTVNFRVATTATSQQLQLKTSDGTVLTTLSIPQTGAYQIWKTASATVTLKAGVQTLRIASIQNGFWNLNWAEFVFAPPVGLPSYAAIPGKIEAESYSAMFGVIAEATADANGGSDIGWIELGDWMDYNVNVATAGSYTVNFRLASPNAGQQLQLKASDGTVLATVSVPQTGAFQTWRTVSATVTLKAGNQTIRVISSQSGWWNFNWFEFVSASSTPAALPGYGLIPGKIEAETYTLNFGVISETTSDIGGGQDVGWIELGDWFEYNVYVATSANYNVNFRIATPNVNQQLQVRNAAGAVLATVNLPQTGGFQTWRTVTAPLYLFAGNQTIRVYSMNGWWNINWMEFIAASSSSADPITQSGSSVSAGTVSAENIPLASQVFSIYPNPVDKVVSMQIRNNYTGAMNIQVVNLAGIVVKQFKLSKASPVSQLNLPVGELPTGNYMIKVQIGKWSETKKLIKL